ncbi:MFS transporter [Campylobacter sp. MG1]|uniref:MFS transporter n=1 Tax=Campylobacter sp. MG1 TaxID=2976332 RepID=UPI00226CBFA9|nr:MFS transporter [Campylobacter sp. MG1]
MREYIRLLQENKSFKILTIVQFITYFGAWFSQIGVYTMLIEFDFSLFEWNYFGINFDDSSVKKLALSFSTIFAFLPTIILAPASGVIIDSFKSKKLLLLSIIIELFSVFLLIFIKDASYIFILFILIFIRLAVASLYFQTQMSLLACIFDRDKLKLANELFSIIWAVSYTSGMALAGFFIHKFGVYSAFMLDCFLFLIGIILLFFIKIEVSNNKFYFKNITKMTKEGFLYIFRNKKILHLILIHAFVGLTAYDTLVNFLAGYEYFNKVFFFKEMLSVALIIGLINAVRAFSLIIGPFVLSKFVNNKTLFYLFLAQGFGIIIWAYLQFNFWLSFIGLVCTGFFTNIIWSYTYTAVQSACDKEYYGRVIAYVDMIFMSFSLFATLITGYLFDIGISTFSITIMLGICFILGALYWLYFIKTYE